MYRAGKDGLKRRMQPIDPPAQRPANRFGREAAQPCIELVDRVGFMKGAGQCRRRVFLALPECPADRSRRAQVLISIDRPEFARRPVPSTLWTAPSPTATPPAVRGTAAIFAFQFAKAAAFARVLRFYCRSMLEGAGCGGRCSGRGGHAPFLRPWSSWRYRGASRWGRTTCRPTL